MATITIPDVPDDLLEAVRRSAHANGRTVEDELREAVRRLYSGERITNVLANARHRWTTKDVPHERLKEWINEGRP